jgi:hypothetical protein
MNEPVPCKPSVRPMYDWEIQEARKVFADGLRYERVRIHECRRWTNAMDRLGRRLKGMPLEDVNNALTLGNHCYFPVKLLDQLVPINHSENYKLGWLIHELTHAWQYQHMGWRYLWLALSAQFRQKGAAYNFDGEDGLKKRRRDAWTLQKFNLEQQGDIARSYYERTCRGIDVSAWQPFIDEFQKLA